MAKRRKSPRPPKLPKPQINLNPDGFLGSVATYIAIPIYVLEFFKRHNTIRKWLLRFGAMVIATYFIWGTDGVAFIFSIAMFAMNLLYAIGFMMIQFVGLFWFMSRTRVIEVHPKDPKNISFDDYWGQSYIVDHVKQWNKLLAQRGKFEELGGKPLNGLLLVGPPGTGKTMLAKAMAGDQGIAFIGMEGSGFRAMFWGVDTMKMIAFVRKGRGLAKRYGACIAYIDEIDAIGMSRGSVDQGGGQAQTQMAGGMFGMGMSGALTRLLYEMDGLEEIGEWDTAQNKARRIFGLDMIDQGKLMFMGATNRPSVLDPALLRPGRFDEQIVVGPGHEDDRREVIKGYLGTIKASPEIDVEALVQDTPGATPALIMAAITKGAVKRAVFEDHDEVTQEDIELAFQEKMIGLQNPITNWDPKQKRAVAAHEAGHAVAINYIRKRKRLVRASIIRRGRALGYVLDVDPKDIYAHPLRNWEEDIAVSISGHLAVKVVTGEEWTGMGSDLMKIKGLARALAAHGKFGTFGAILSSGPNGNVTPELEKDVNDYLNTMIERVEALLRQHEEELLTLTDELVEREDLNGREVRELLGWEIEEDE